MKYAARLAKIAAAFPVQELSIEVADDRPRVSLDEIIAGIKAETSRIEAMKPVERIRHWLDHIADKTAEVARPPTDFPHGIHACLQKLVKDDFPTVRYQIRADELAILREARYDCTDLANDHKALQDLPWQWNSYAKPLPPTAASIVDALLKSLEVSA